VVVLEALERANQVMGPATAIITHNAAQASMAQRIVRLSDGSITSIDDNHDRKLARELAW
jgi:putative ABC transport system ATP-binding protein